MKKAKEQIEFDKNIVQRFLATVHSLQVVFCFVRSTEARFFRIFVAFLFVWFCTVKKVRRCY